MNVNDFPKIFDNTKKVIIYNKGKIIPGMTNFGYSEITICVFFNFILQYPWCWNEDISDSLYFCYTPSAINIKKNIIIF